MGKLKQESLEQLQEKDLFNDEMIHHLVLKLNTLYDESVNKLFSIKKYNIMSNGEIELNMSNEGDFYSEVAQLCIKTTDNLHQLRKMGIL